MVKAQTVRDIDALIAMDDASNNTPEELDEVDGGSEAGETPLPLFSTGPVYDSRKKSNTQELLKLIVHCKIINSEMFSAFLCIEPKLKTLCMKVPANQLESLKKQGFEIVLSEFSVPSYQDLFQAGDFLCHICSDLNPCCELPHHLSKEEIIAISTWWQIFASIAEENDCTIYTFFKSVFDVLNLNHNKMCAIGFWGPTGTCKSLAARFLISLYESYEVGKCQVPATGGQNKFWLSSLVGKKVYFIEEIALECTEKVQELKNLFEGSGQLMAEVKYKDPWPLPRAPVVYSYNGDKASDLVMHFSSEWPTMKARSLFFKCKKTLEDRFTTEKEWDVGIAVQYQRYVLEKFYNYFYVVPQKVEERQATLSTEYLSNMF